MNHVSKARRLCRALPEAVAFLCAGAMLFVLPLLFHDAFFDINRVKVGFVLRAVPVFAAAMVLAWIIRGRAGGKGAPWKEIARPCAALLLFLLACVASSARVGFSSDVLTGSEGRYCGLWFFLACGAAFFVIAAGALRGKALMMWTLIAASVCSALGFANALGIDPLGFYAEIRPGQESAFLSTIGHFDFFGTYLVMMLGLAGGLCIFASGAKERALASVCAVIIAFGASASRTDSAFLGMHLVCAALLALSGGSLSAMARALVLWAVCFATLPVTRAALAHSLYDAAFSGLPLLLCEKGIALILSGLLLMAGAACMTLAGRGARAPGQKRMMIAVMLVLVLAALALLGVIVYFTAFDSQADLGSASTFLRFSDEWGSLRGFVYLRAVRAYADFTAAEKLLGKGLDTARAILTPYFDNPAGLASGVFNDAHCQPLQLLITGGLLTALAFAAFYLSMLAALVRHAGDDPILCGALAALFGYALIMLLNVTQPILISTYLSVAALAASRIRYLSRKGGGWPNES